jgi:hypothetical protein
MSDVVNHPPHYNQGDVECIQALESLGISQVYCRANALKYLWRMADKGKALEDVKKAQWYVNRLVGYLESEAHVTERNASVDASVGSVQGSLEDIRLYEDSQVALAALGDGGSVSTSDCNWPYEIQCGGGP